jgi:lipoate-protein ligase B
MSGARGRCRRRPDLLLWACWPRLDYARGLALQHRLHAARRCGYIPDFVIVTEHPPTATLGRRGSLADLPVGPSELAARGIALFRVGRGGRATFHGPGQLVAYPIVGLAERGLGPRRFVEAIENALATALRACGVDGIGSGPMPGLWVGDRKLAAIGIEILDGVTRHGLAVNLRGGMDGFDAIVPCGAAEHRPVSVDALGISPPRPREVADRFCHELAGALGLQSRAVDPAAFDDLARIDLARRDERGRIRTKREALGSAPDDHDRETQ